LANTPEIGRDGTGRHETAGTWLGFIVRSDIRLVSMLVKLI
jgi:hypothetical protein